MTLMTLMTLIRDFLNAIPICPTTKPIALPHRLGRFTCEVIADARAGGEADGRALVGGGAEGGGEDADGLVLEAPQAHQLRPPSKRDPKWTSGSDQSTPTHPRTKVAVQQ